MSSSPIERTSRFRLLKRWRAPRPPTPRWRGIPEPTTTVDMPPVPALSFFEPDSPIELPQCEPASPFGFEALLDKNVEDSARQRSNSAATAADTEIDTLSQLGSGILTPWPSPMSCMSDLEGEAEIVERVIETCFTPLELSLPSPLLSPRWMFPRTPPCLPITRRSSSTLSSVSHNYSSTMSSVSSLSCPSSMTSRCTSTCDTDIHIEVSAPMEEKSIQSSATQKEMHLDLSAPMKLKSVGWDIDSPVRLHFGDVKKDRRALRASIIERRLGLKGDAEDGNGQRLGIRVDSVRRG